MKVLTRIDRKLEAWLLTGEPQATPQFPVLTATIGDEVLLCPSYPEAGAQGAICSVGDESTVWFGDVIPVGDPRLSGNVGTLRLTGACCRSSCGNWSNGCHLGAVVASVSPAESERPLPTCPIRGRCRWHVENGDSACRTCEVVLREG